MNCLSKQERIALYHHTYIREGFENRHFNEFSTERITLQLTRPFQRWNVFLCGPFAVGYCLDHAVTTRHSSFFVASKTLDLRRLDLAPITLLMQYVYRPKVM
jgi:hypothetical protein